MSRTLFLIASAVIITILAQTFLPWPLLIPAEIAIIYLWVHSAGIFAFASNFGAAAFSQWWRGVNWSWTGLLGWVRTPGRIDLHADLGELSDEEKLQRVTDLTMCLSKTLQSLGAEARAERQNMLAREFGILKEYPAFGTFMSSGVSEAGWNTWMPNR
jgi:hypothetical protein